MESLKDQIDSLVGDVIKKLDEKEQACKAIANRASLRADELDRFENQLIDTRVELERRERAVASVQSVASKRLATIKVYEANQAELVKKNRELKSTIKDLEQQKKELENVCARSIADKKKLEAILDDIPDNLTLKRKNGKSSLAMDGPYKAIAADAQEVRGS